MTVNGEDLARAKINLFLHVRNRRSDGFHTLESMVAFPVYGDSVSVKPASQLSLSIGGKFAQNLGGGSDNLVMAAAQAIVTRFRPSSGADMHLEKRLPVAAGIGGGSADAGAALRLLARHWHITDQSALAEIAISLGADAPMCLAQQPAMIGGIGEQLTPPPSFPAFWVVMINPRVPVLTAQVFGALTNRENPPGPDAPSAFDDPGAMAEWLSLQRNDLESPARLICPAIDDVLNALSSRKDCLLARMSGSGATCFGIFATGQSADLAAAELQRRQPDWWVVAAPVEAYGST